MGAPDYAAAFVGWRSWLVVLVEGEYRLCSPVYPTIWPPRQETRAFCRKREGFATRLHFSEHRAPEERCRCGIYASDTPERAAQVLASVNTAAHAYPVEQPVFGRVSLWGQVVECEQGWRAACAYPAALYVPALSEPTPPAPARGRLARLHHDPHTRSDRWLERPGPNHTPHPAQVARALEHYGVPIHILPCQTLHHAAEQLAQPQTLRTG